MSSREFAEWMAYEQVAGPLGPERLDLLHADLMALTFNIWAKKGKEKKPKDFVVDWDRKKAQSPEDMLAMLRNWTVFAGGTVRIREEE
jgi:hypothetical protein